jgi:hypothetical protein
MNWKKLKEKFPKVHDDLRENFKDNLMDEGRQLIESYIESKGFKPGFLFMIKLELIEKKLKRVNNPLD